MTAQEKGTKGREQRESGNLPETAMSAGVFPGMPPSVFCPHHSLSPKAAWGGGRLSTGAP